MKSIIYIILRHSAYLLALVALAARAGHFELPAINTLKQDQIASVHIAVTSARPWSDYETALQPHFELSAEQAYDRVSKATQQIDKRTFDGLGVGLKAAIPAPTDPSILTTDTKVMEGSAANVESALKALTAPSAIEANLQYLAATALFQEVQLINRSFRDALEFQGQECYVVRLQVSVIPKSREAPYDVTSDLSFFLNRVEKEPKLGDGPVIVIPMLATDSIESALSSRSEERLRSLSLAITAILPQAGIGAALDRLKDTLDAANGRDYNSSFTVARVTDNTVRCRFGAISQTTFKYSLVPQNHFVTLLVFVPRQTDFQVSSLRVCSNNSLINTNNGKKVAQRASTEFITQFEKYMSSNGITFCDSVTNKRQTIGALLKSVALGKSATYLEFLECRDKLIQNGEKPFADILWSDITSILAGSQYGLAEFELPPPPMFNEDKLAQWVKKYGKSVLAIDDGEVTVFELHGFPRMRRDSITARLEVSGVKWAEDIVSGPGVYDEASQSMTFRFPSLANPAPVEMVSGVLRLQILKWQAPTKAQYNSDAERGIMESQPIKVNYLAIKKAKRTPQTHFILSAATKYIIADERGAGSVTFAISKVKTNSISIKGTIEGANITKASPTNKAIKAGAITWAADKMEDDTEVTFDLNGLHPDQKVVISGTGDTGDGSSESISFTVGSIK